MFSRNSPVRWSSLGALSAVLALSACETLPKIRTEVAPGVNLGAYHTYDYFEKPSTDRRGYTTITTRSVESAIDREMGARGFVRSANPDLKINFNIAKRDKVTTTPGFGYDAGFGGWRRGYGWGLGVGTRGDVETVTEGTLTVDLVDRAKNELVWSGSAVRTLNAKILDQPRQAIDQAVNLIFAKFPGPGPVPAAK
jgi:hypothetical protein